MKCCKGNIYDAIRFERDSLEGNLNRMSVCDTYEELYKMSLYAHLRITNLYRLQHQRLAEYFLEHEKMEKDIRNDN